MQYSAPLFASGVRVRGQVAGAAAVQRPPGAQRVKGIAQEPNIGSLLGPFNP